MLIVASFTKAQDFQFLKSVLHDEYGLIEKTILDETENQPAMNELAIYVSKNKIKLYYGLPRIPNYDLIEYQSKETAEDLIMGIFYLVDEPQKLSAYIPAAHQSHIGTTVFMEPHIENNIYCRKINVSHSNTEKCIPILSASSATSQFLNILFLKSYAETINLK